ncbi:MAG TPA: hypothetical protein VGM87_06535 [Roseomonas sp.]|jgi:hypothetical protein
MRLVAMAMLLLAGCGAAAMPDGAAAGPDRPALARMAAAFPPELAGFRRVGEITDYESRPGGAGLGASASYRPADGAGAAATIYLYDRGRRRQVDGGHSPDIAEELRMTRAEIDALVRAGRYRAVTPEAGMRVAGTPDAGGMRCLNFRVVQANGSPTGDSVCVSVQGGVFVKVRVTASSTPEPAVAGLFASGLLSAMLQTRSGGPNDRPAAPQASPPR